MGFLALAFGLGFFFGMFVLFTAMFEDVSSFVRYWKWKKQDDFIVMERDMRYLKESKNRL